MVICPHSSDQHHQTSPRRLFCRDPCATLHHAHARSFRLDPCLPVFFLPRHLRLRMHPYSPRRAAPRHATTHPLPLFEFPPLRRSFYQPSPFHFTILERTRRSALSPETAPPSIYLFRQIRPRLAHPFGWAVEPTAQLVNWPPPVTHPPIIIIAAQRIIIIIPLWRSLIDHPHCRMPQSRSQPCLFIAVTLSRHSLTHLLTHLLTHSLLSLPILNLNSAGQSLLLSPFDGMETNDGGRSCRSPASDRCELPALPSINLARSTASLFVYPFVWLSVCHRAFCLKATSKPTGH